MSTAKAFLGFGSFKGEKLRTIPLVDQSAAVTSLEKIWECLMNDEISRVGVYGMGGVGKTTIVTHINNRLIRNVNAFAHIYWVTVSKTSSIYKLQSDIAKVLKVDLSIEDDEQKRAAKLWETLNRGKEFVLILDDVWEAFAIEKVGIPLLNGGKLLLTTRMHQVCQRMRCQQIIKVESLSEQESWDLFIKEAECETDFSLEYKEIVESVIQECAGLPLAIVSVARSMRGIVKISEWRNILQELKKPSKGINREMEEEVFKPLKISYDRLHNARLQQCLLYCSLYPEDESIRREDLIRNWIGEGLIDELDSRQAEIDRGNAIIDKLIDASLLEHAEDAIGKSDACVKMHDVVRDMAITLTRQNFMVKDGAYVRLLLKESEWSVNLECASLMKNIKLSRCVTNFAPNCPKLRTLLIQKNVYLMELPYCFFGNMQNLTVLDMSYSLDLKVLPKSISKLRNLRALILRLCISLQCIPSLAQLERLQELDLSLCKKLKRLPNGLEKLVNLRAVNLSRNVSLNAYFPSDMLRKLSYLQSLRLDFSNVSVQPNVLVNLNKLEMLGITFSDCDTCISYFKSEHWQRLEEYCISAAPTWVIELQSRSTCFYHDGSSKSSFFKYFQNDENTYKKVVCLNLRTSTKENKAGIFLPNNIQYFELRYSNGLKLDLLKKTTFADLQKLVITEYDGKCLFNQAVSQQVLHNLKELHVESSNLEEIIGSLEDSLNQSCRKTYPTIELPTLVKLTLKSLPILCSIYRGRMVCPSLEAVEIEDCMILERLPFSIQGVQTNSSIQVLSLDQVEEQTNSTSQWDHLLVKPVSQPIFHEIIDNFYKVPELAPEINTDIESESEPCVDNQSGQNLLYGLGSLVSVPKGFNFKGFTANRIR